MALAGMTVTRADAGHTRAKSIRLPIVGFAVAITLLVGTGLTLFVTMRQMAESQAAVDDTYAALRRIDEISLSLAEIINTTRGFVLTGSEDILTPAEGLRRQLVDDLLVLEGLFAQKPAQLRRLATLRPLLDRRLAMDQEYVPVRRQNDLQTTTDAIPAGGDVLVRQIRRGLAEIAMAETSLLSEQRLDEAAMNNRAQFVMTFAGTIALLILSIAFVALRRQTFERMRTESSLRTVEDQLRQSQKLEAVGRLAGGVAHDFNNLLMIILAHGDQLLRRLDKTDPLQRSAAAISKAGERAGALTGHLLAFSRQQVMRPETVDLNDAVRELLSMLSRTIGEDIELVTNLADNLDAVHADRGQLGQVILNLVVNAQDAMPSGGQLTIETGRGETAPGAESTPSRPLLGSYLRLTVRDSGVGMDAETRSRVFEPFFTTKEVGKGTGLGMSTVYGIVTQSGGHVSVDSELGMGTSVNVLLPITQGGTPARPAPAEDVIASRRGTETVLAVEDDPEVRMLTVSWLRQHGYTVLDAGDGAEALSVADQYAGPIHALVTDVVMPHVNGRELFERLSRTRADITVLFVSGFHTESMIRDGKLAQGAPLLLKPFTCTALLQRIRDVLDAHDRPPAEPPAARPAS
jgi:signal transduction histidine kinase/CheY-like chemotaxis protein